MNPRGGARSRCDAQPRMSACEAFVGARPRLPSSKQEKHKEKKRNKKDESKQQLSTSHWAGCASGQFCRSDPLNRERFSERAGPEYFAAGGATATGEVGAASHRPR